MSRVQTVEAIPVSYPEPNDFNALRHLCLVKITTNDGVVGWGESITQFPEANFAVKAIIEGMADRVVGRDPLDNVAIWHSLRDQAWWCGYGPYDKPSLVVCAMIENGGHGGVVAAPVALQVFQKFFKVDHGEIGRAHV